MAQRLTACGSLQHPFERMQMQQVRVHSLQTAAQLQLMCQVTHYIAVATTQQPGLAWHLLEVFCFCPPFVLRALTTTVPRP